VQSEAVGMVWHSMRREEGKGGRQRAKGVVAVLVGGRTAVWDWLDCGFSSTSAHVGSGHGGVARPGCFGLDGVRVRHGVVVLPGDR